MLSTEVSRRVGKVRFVDNPLCMDEEEYLPEKRVNCISLRFYTVLHVSAVGLLFHESR